MPLPRPDPARACTLPCEVLVVHDTPDDTTVPYAEKFAPTTTPRVRTVLNTYGRGPANAIRFGIDAAQAPRRGGHDGRRLRRPAPDRRRWPGSSSAAWSWRPRRATCPAASRSAARGSSGRCPRCAGRSLHTVRPGRHPRRDEQLQGVLDGRSSGRSASTADDRLRDRHRAHRQGAPAAAAGRGDPHDLARPRSSASLHFKVGRWLPSYLAGTASRSAAGSPSRAASDGPRHGSDPRQLTSTRS